MWNSGSDVMRRSSAVSSIQYGNPAPAMPYARWVCMTSFDRPVVPDVGMSTARSSGVTSTVRLDEDPTSVRQSPTSESMSIWPSAGTSAAPVSFNAGTTAPSVMSARGWTCPTSPASSGAVPDGSVGTVTAPSDASASQVSRYGGVVRAVITTRSPRRTPASRRWSAMTATRPAAPPNVNVPSSVRNHVPRGSRPAAATTSPGIVSCIGAAGQARAGDMAGRRRRWWAPRTSVCGRCIRPVSRSRRAGRRPGVAGNRKGTSMPTLALPGADLYYEMVGDGVPVVFVHGLGLDTRMWDDQVDALRPLATVIRYDARGFGRSLRLDNVTEYTNSADLWMLLDHVGVDSAVLVGLSMGGGIVLEATVERPERVRAMVLLDPYLDGVPWDDES